MEGPNEKIVNFNEAIHVNQIDNLIGTIVHGEEEAYNLYNTYAIRTGFSVRKSRKRSGVDGSIRQIEYCCAKEGHMYDKDFSVQQRQTLETRTGCGAMIRFTVEDGKWKVTSFVSSHNHELALHSEIHMLRSNRKLTFSKTNVINSMVDAGLRTIDTFSYMSKEAGGDEHLGFTKRDCYNYVHHKKMSLIEAGDSQSLVNHFEECLAEDGMFYYTTQVDQESRMTNFFWRDGRSRIDYDYFGDVIVFDTTYRTNKYDLICAPFVGVNHHRKNVMFGCAFLSDETISFFIWLFKSFLKSMGDKAPQTIFTDQDQEMANAISVVFPETRHRLCIWHISQNAPSHLGSLNSNKEFRLLFYKMLHRCESENEFDEVWNKICDSFEEVRNHKWLKKLYDIRQKWCKGLNKDVFSAGILSSQRSEVTNRVLKTISSKTASLTKFVHEFETIVARWRTSEFEKDFRCKQGTPSLLLKTSGLLNHAASIYTCEIFKHFEKNFWQVMATSSVEVTYSNNIRMYEVQSEAVNSKKWIVHFDISSMSISCSCKKFESKGFVCYHILRVLSMDNVKKIPESCILHRWIKGAKKRLYVDRLTEVDSEITQETNSMFRNDVMRCLYDVATRSQENIRCRKICKDSLKKLIVNIERELSTLNLEESCNIEERETNSVKGKKKITDVELILSPPRAKPKGTSNARLK